MRLPVTPQLSTKDGVSAKNARLTNMLKVSGPKDIAEIRPGLVLDAQASGVGNGLVVFNNELVSVYGSTLGIGISLEPLVVTDRSLPREYDTVTIGGWDGSQFVGRGAVVNDNYSITSSDCITWSEHFIGTFTWGGDLVPKWNGSQWFFFPITGGTTKVYTSSDGISWSSETTNLGGTGHSISFGNGIFCAVESGSTSIFTSSDGVTWAEYSSVLPSNIGWSSVFFLDGAFYILELDAAATTPSDLFVTSSDGVSWTSGTMLSASFWISLASSDGILFATSVGYGFSSSDVGAMSSDNGATWTQVTLPTSDIWGVFGYASGFYASAVVTPNLAYSVDGLTWDSVAWTAFVGTLASNSEVIVAAYTLLTGIGSIVPIARGIPPLDAITGDKYDFAQSPI